MLANWRRKLQRTSKVASSTSRSFGGRGLKPRFVPEVLLLQDRLVPSPAPGSAGVLSQFVVDGFPNPATAGASSTLTVMAEDSLGGTITNYTGTVHFTSSDPSAVLPADYTFLLT